MCKFIEIIDSDNTTCILNVDNIIAITKYDGGYARIKFGIGGTLDTAVPYESMIKALKEIYGKR